MSEQQLLHHRVSSSLRFTSSEPANIIQVNKIKSKDEKFNQLLNDAVLSEKQRKILMTQKIHYRYAIIIGCIMLKISSDLICEVSKYQTIQFNMSSISSWIEYIFTLVFQAYFGILTDFISVPITMGFTIAITSIAQFFVLISLLYTSDLLNIVSQFMGTMAACGIYISGLSLIYENSYHLKQQFRDSSLFVLIGSFFTKTILNLVYLSIDNEKTQPVPSEQGKMFITLLSIVFLVNGAIIVSVSVGRIKKIKREFRKEQKIIKYEYFLTRSALSLTSVIDYYWHPDFRYLFMVGFQCNNGIYLTGIFNSILSHLDGNYTDDSNDDIFSGSTQVGSLVFGSILLWHLNKKKHFITQSYEIINMILKSSLVVYTILFIVIVFMQGILEYTPQYVIFQIVLLYLGFVRFTVYFVCNMMLLSLQENQITLRGIGLGIVGLMQDLSSVIFLITDRNEIIFSVLLIILIVVNLANHAYRKNRSFSKLQSELAETQFDATVIQRISTTPTENSGNENEENQESAYSSI